MHKGNDPKRNKLLMRQISRERIRMGKMKTYFRRMKTMSFRRMVMYAKKARAESRKPLVFVIIDIIWCSLRYGVGYLDYLSFGFIHQKGRQRKTYMTMNDNLRLIRRLNHTEKQILFEDKCKFLSRFTTFVQRDFLDLREDSFETFAAFCKKHPVFFAKEPQNYGGLGVSRIDVAQAGDLTQLYQALLDQKQFCVEEQVVQHPKAGLLNETSVNTVRMVTILKNGEAHLMYAIVRMGGGDAFVDNVSSGGMYCPLNEKGMITAPAFCDKTGEYYAQHPASGTALVGFQIPMYAEAVGLVRQAALVEPAVRYVGWDIAISEHGPVIIEGNTYPAYDMCQNYRHLGPDKIGMKPRFQAILKDEY